MKDCGGGGSGRAVVKGCGCLLGLFSVPLVSVVLLLIVVMWCMTSLFSCSTEVALSELLGVELTKEEEQMLKEGLRAEAVVYQKIGSYFREQDSAAAAAVAQAFYIMYRDKVLAREDYLECLVYCFSDGVRLRTIERVRERFVVELTEEKLDLLITYARNNYMDTSGFRPEKNGTDLARLARLAFADWAYYPNTYGNVLTLDAVYGKDMEMSAMTRLGYRTVDNLGLLKAYAWLDKDTGEIKASDTNEIVTNYEDAAAVIKRAAKTWPIDELVTIGEPGMGVYSETTGMLGIYVGDGAVIYADDITQTIAQEGVLDGAWSKCFYFAGLDYDNQAPELAQLHIVVYSNYLTQAKLCLWGPESLDITLFFIDDKATADVTVEAGTYHASLQSMTAGLGEIPQAVYGEWRDFVVEGSGYYEIEYLIDQQ
ncbi:MAG: hypothetical protein Q4C48_06805 [Lachnospiraceae bacterium]|nr:hypothetical protein [Lachnospiraceae bacterium]